MEEKFKEIIDSKWTHSIESDNIDIFYNVNNGNYEIEYDTMITPLKEILAEFNEITYNALNSLPVKEVVNTDNMSKPISELSKEELLELISKMAEFNEIAHNTLNSPSVKEVVKNTASKRTLDIVDKFQHKLVGTLGYEDIAINTINLKEYINGLSREELQVIKDDLNHYVFDVPNNSIVLSVLKDAVTSYIGYIDAVRAINPNLKVDVFGRSIINNSEVKNVSSQNGDYSIPVEFSGNKTSKAEKIERKKSPFGSMVRKWKEE